MNKYLKNLNKIEFVVTYACTGRCKHCSEGDHKTVGEGIDPIFAADAVKAVCGLYPIQTVMTFGGEPLLHRSAVYAIHRAARDMDVPKRQLITNGYFSNDEDCIAEVAALLAESGVNDVRLSVDAFHQETIPLVPVMVFAHALYKRGVPVYTQPAWLVSPDADNPYNTKTREILAKFYAMDIAQGGGNVIFPQGNALIYLKDYFKNAQTVNPYEEDPFDVKTISVEPDGATLGGNICTQDIREIITAYNPEKTV